MTAAASPSASAATSGFGSNNKSMSSVISLASGSSVTTQVWPAVAEPVRRHARRRARTGQVEVRLETRKTAQARHARHRRTGIRIGGKLEMPALLRHLVERDRNMPRRHCDFVSFRHARRSPDLENPPCPPSRRLPAGWLIGRSPRARSARARLPFSPGPLAEDIARQRLLNLLRSAAPSALT